MFEAFIRGRQHGRNACSDQRNLAIMIATNTSLFRAIKPVGQLQELLVAAYIP
jgi:hypothetical protein